MNKGFLSIVLHAHLPYVRHPEHESFFEESWLFEAITECYIPLINVLDRLQKDKVNYQLTLSLSPTLISMLDDDLLKERYLGYLNQRIELAEKEIIRTKKQTSYQKLARLYRRFFISAKNTYVNKYDGHLLKAFIKHRSSGQLEIITTAATHGVLPLLNISETAVRNQINIGIDTFISKLGFSPLGFWLPECGYYPGLEKTLKQAGINYFIIDTHGILDSSSSPEQSVYEPLDCGNGVMAYARDPESSHQVWSAQEGYPGGQNYREYYSDIGYELDIDYIKPYILDQQIRINTGIKYHQVTKTGQKKEIYNPRKAQQKADLDAKDFISKRHRQVNQLNNAMEKQPIIISPFDAELFGHWWFEGARWLERVLRLAAQPDNNVLTISCSYYLGIYPAHPVATPSFSTWGEKGYTSYWINEKNNWIYPFLQKATDEMEQLSKDFSKVTVSPLQERALNQALRTVLLAQASDWPFILKSGTATDYAKKKMTDNFARFNYLHDSLRKNNINERYLAALEYMDNIFPEINFRSYSSDFLKK